MELFQDSGQAPGPSLLQGRVGLFVFSHQIEICIPVLADELKL